MKAGALVLRRLGLMVLILFLVSGLIFAIVNLLPGDVATAVLGDGATPQQIEDQVLSPGHRIIKGRLSRDTANAWNRLATG